MIYRIWIKLFGGVLVYLRDNDGSFYLRIAQKSPFNELVATNRYGTQMILKEDGTIIGSRFTTNWTYYD